MSEQLFIISLVDLQGLTTHAATASSAAADDNRIREQKAWDQFDAIVGRVRGAKTDDVTQALRRLTLAARTSGGTAGPDAELMAACDQAESLLMGLDASQMLFNEMKKAGFS